MKNLKSNNYYFTFGTDTNFPFQNGYIIVRADNWRRAVSLFRVYFPDYIPGILHCSDYYKEQEWIEHVAQHYENQAPFMVLVGGNQYDIWRDVEKESALADLGLFIENSPNPEDYSSMTDEEKMMIAEEYLETSTNHWVDRMDDCIERVWANK